MRVQTYLMAERHLNLWYILRVRAYVRIVGWIVSNHRFKISKSCQTFAPGNLRASYDNHDYKRLIDHWISERYTLRYGTQYTMLVYCSIYRYILVGMVVVALPSAVVRCILLLHIIHGGRTVAL
jgi:hypothetical protein